MKLTKKKIALIAFGVIIVAGALGDHPAPSQQARSTEPNVTASSSGGTLTESNQSLFIVAAQEGIERKLKDPSSAKFRSVFYNYNEANRTHVACGMVNAKNSFGAYKGFERFVSDGRQVHVLESDMKSGQEFAKVWNKLCQK